MTNELTTRESTQHVLAEVLADILGGGADRYRPDTELFGSLPELDSLALVELIVVVEVRTRGPGAWTTGFGSIDVAKRRRIRRAGERLWQRRYKNDASVERMRFDAASVNFEATGRAVVEYAEAAF